MIVESDQPHVEVVTCRKQTAKVAEERAAIYAAASLRGTGSRDRAATVPSAYRSGRETYKG